MDIWWDEHTFVPSDIYYSIEYGQAIASDLLTPNLSFLWFLLSSLATKMCGLSKYCKNTVKYCDYIVPSLSVGMSKEASFKA